MGRDAACNCATLSRTGDGGWYHHRASELVGQPPAVLKGWVDRVFRAGVAYKFLEGDKGDGVPVGLLKIRTAIVFNTSNTPPVREKKVFGDPCN